ncbi:replication endonuclease [Salmonella enterica]|nr:replication endonuclease [Salmonella enterica subsp. enterica serovar Infantis]EGM2178456.1 replication endonuclease [Salmonella enterica]EHA0389179.1 replication endonuclease [Salmonella enterica]EHM3979903.1 replication endonuclease [Salmonella enterica subsp. enterica serovar Infantis]EHO3085225.1 replication endonuclease [Salmonella enterica subsp. enterica serovar Infantis]
MSAPYVWEWNAPRPAIDPATFGNEHPEESEIARLIALFDKEREQNRQQKTADSPKYLRKIEAASDKDASRDAELMRTAKERLAAASDKDNPVLTRLYALPSYLRAPLKQHLKFLRIKQAQAEKAGKKARPASRYIHGKLTRILDRIEQTDARFCTQGYQRIVAIERLDALLTLPQLNKYEVQTAATLTASAFNCEFDRLCTQYGDDMTLNDALTVYQKLADRALLLNITPPYYESLRTDRDRRTEPDIEKLPGAFLRLSCADWWNRKLWRLRRIWREEQLRAACLVSRKKSAYLSRDALTEFREQRRRMKEFLRSYELVNEDGFTIDMTDVYYSGNSNPQHRRYEMMANMKGLELIAQERGDEAVFVTVTCPSAWHATTEDGHPNPKWNGSTIRDTSDYLVNVFFAAVRKKLNRKKLRWYGVRVAEPHHDGTVHWHMMIFVRPEERETIVNEMQEIAIREDRDELGDDITPRFMHELITPDKGTPTGYIASYIGKNLDKGAVKGNDPKTGKPRVDNESGLAMAESVERAIGWAGLHGVRQFQFFGIPSRQVWRELRRLASQLQRNPQGPQKLKDPAMDSVMVAADAGCFASYITKQGGVLVPRKDYVVRTAYDLADKPNDYGETGIQIYGIWSPLIGEHSRICTHPDNWTLVKKQPKPKDDATEQAFEVDLPGGFAAPWTRGNNCPRQQKNNIPTAEDRVLRALARKGIHISDGEITLLMSGIRMLQDDRIYRVKDGILHDEATVNGLIARWQQAIRRKNE